MTRVDEVLVTCEHGGARVPPAWRRLFRSRADLLSGHRAFDPGALALARRLARGTKAAIVASTTTRLLVDLNRSPHNPRVFSEITRRLARAERERLLHRLHAPHWERVGAQVERAAARGRRLLHVAVHTFTPVWRGRARPCDVALLYDPGRQAERAFADRWLGALARLRPDLRLRRNYPYRGAADGLTTALRRRLPARRYLGIELEVNQRFPAGPAPAWRRLVDDLASSLAACTPDAGA